MRGFARLATAVWTYHNMLRIPSQEAKGIGHGRGVGANNPFNHPPVPLPLWEGGDEAENGGHTRSPGSGSSPLYTPSHMHSNKTP